MACAAAAVAFAAISEKSAGAGMGDRRGKRLGMVERMGMVSMSSSVCCCGEVWGVAVGTIGCGVAAASEREGDIASADVR
jgi:hypothetical protein